MLTIFIGSSTEAVERGLTDEVASALSDGHFQVLLWHEIFTVGYTVVENLESVFKRVDAAILIFSQDDDLISRERSQRMARDNVILEYGSFFSRLGRERVYLLAEEGLHLPSDLGGVIVGKLRTQTVDLTLLSIRKEAEKIRSQWSKLKPFPRRLSIDIDDGGIGVGRAIRTLQNKLFDIAEDLESIPSGSLRKDPIHFDSHEACLIAYSEALSRVTETFRTTTFLSSGFWIGENMRVVSANQAMMQRLKPKKGSVRRLFMLQQPAALTLLRRKQTFIHLHQQQDEPGKRRLREELVALNRNLAYLIHEGCEIKVAFDKDELYKSLASDLDFDPGDDEIAIYDDFRVDVFSGGRIGRISDVRIFSHANDFFGSIRDQFESYFERLWADAEPISSFIHQLEAADFAASRRIDYASNWLAIYEYHLSSRERSLKTKELKWVSAYLEEALLWGNVERYLDIGTCTARYPINLRGAVVPEGRIIGIDDDDDCVKFALYNSRRRTRNDGRIEILQRDFLGGDIENLGSFHLITCMLGTVSHFGFDKNSRFEDSLQKALRSMRRLLAEGGKLILSLWSRYACEERQMLNIYSPHDRQQLASWSPNSEELRRRLELAGLRVIKSASPDRRLDVFVCSS
jgi:SAM-dependent methyltransferase